MENQINVSDQNTQRAGQNSTNQPMPVSEKPKINYWMISIVILLMVLLIGGGWFIFNSKNKTYSKQQPGTVQSDQTTTTGVIRTSGLSEEDKQKFGLTTVNYQVTDFGDYPKTYQTGQIMGYFLLSNDLNDELLGKCVQVTGVIPEEWKNKKNADAYNRSVLNVTKIEKVDYSNCKPYSQIQPTAGSTQEKLLLRGTVVHAKRPAPDIGYDYQLKLVEPIVDKFSSAGSPQKVSLADVTPTTNTLWNELENNIDKEITVEGYMVWGYAESRYLQIINIKGAGTSEEPEVKDLIAKFEKYIQDRNVRGLMFLFTSTKTVEETASYRNLMGLDPDVGAPRLFNNVTSNFIVTNWNISRREYPDNKELITKDNDKYFVIVEETRKSWCNADPCAGTYSFENTGFYVFEIVKQDSSWMVDKYYPQSSSPKTVATKYEALNF